MMSLEQSPIYFLKGSAKVLQVQQQEELHLKPIFSTYEL